MATYIPDAMVVVFSVVDDSTLREGEEILQYLWRTNCMVMVDAPDVGFPILCQLLAALKIAGTSTPL